MSKKNQKVNDTNLDTNLDFDDFEMGFEEFGNDREPTPRPAKSFAKGMKKGFTDTDNIKNILKSNLPKEYGKTLDMLDEISRGTKDFSDEVIKEAKPVIGSLADTADKFLPSTFKRTKNKLEQIRKWASEDEKVGPNKEQLREQGLSIELGRIFDQQAQTQEINEKIARREKALDRGLSLAQHKDILSVLVKVANTSTQTANYTTTINAAYQRKSLETQYRTLFILRDILDEAKESNAKVISNLMAITKNSSLPDYAKVNASEIFKSELAKKLSSRFAEGTGSFFKKGFGKLKDDIKGTIGDIGSVASMANMMADMYQMNQEIEPTSLKDQLAGGAGGFLGKWLASKGGAKFFEMIKKNPKMVENIVKGQNFLGGLQDDLPGRVKKAISSRADNGNMLFQWLDSAFELPTQNTSLQHYSGRSMYDAVPFTNKVAHSITDVIPGYLSRILLELRTDNISRGVKVNDKNLLKFDFRSGKFNTSANIVKETKKAYSAETLSKNSEYYYNDIMSELEKHVDLNDKERSEIAKILLKKGSSGQSLDPDDMTSVEHWADYATSYDLAQKLATGMHGVYGTDSTKEFDKFNYDPNQKAKALKFNKAIRDLSTLKKDFTNQIQAMLDSGLLDEAKEAEVIDAANSLNIELFDKNTATLKGSFKGKGREHKDVLEEYRTRKNSLGDFEGSNTEDLYQFVKKSIIRPGEDDTIGTSDIFAKTNIKKTGAGVLDKLSKIPVFNWNYKKGKGDGGATTNTGPMAQDLHKEFGEDVAPGGKSVDLVNANGVLTKSIQELHEKVKGFVGGDDGDSSPSSFVPPNALSALRGIYYNTSLLTKQQGALLSINTESLKTLASGLGSALGKIDLSAMGKEAQNKYNDAVKYVKENGASSILGRLGDLVSDIGGSMFGVGFRNLKKYGGKAFGLGRKIMGGAKDVASDLLDESKLRALETFDVFVGKEKEPRMISLKIRKGFYVDFDTQKPVRTRKDIQSIKTGIVEVTDDGAQDFVLLASELEQTYFKNVYKSTIELAASGSLGFVKNKASGILNKLIKPSFRNIVDFSKSVLGGVEKLIDKPIDIYVKGKGDVPALLAKKMREGYYNDYNDGSVIERPTQIKGAVFDSEKGEIALSVDDFKAGIVDIHGNPVGTSPWKNIAMAGMGAAISTASWGLNKLTKMPGFMGSMMKKGSNLISSLAGNLPGISFGMFGQESVDILKDIRSILKYQAGLGGKPDELSKIAGKTVSAISNATGISALFQGKEAANDSNVNAVSKDPKAGLKDVSEGKKGNALSVFKMLGGLGSAASSVWNLLRGKKSSSTDDESEQTDQTKDKDESLLSRISKKLSGYGDKFKDSPAAKKVTKVAADGKQYVNGLRKGSWQEREANARNVNDPVERDKAKVREYATKNIFSMIGDVVGGIKKKLSQWLGSAGDAAELAKDIATGGGKGGRRGTGKLARLGKGLMWGARGLAGVTSAASAYSAYDEFKQGNYGKAAMEGALAVGTGALALGKGTALLGGLAKGGLALAGTGMSIAGGVLKAGMVLGSGALTVLTSPVVLGGLAAAGTAYAGYKLYKHLTRKKFNPTEVMRMVEYGLRGGNDELQRKIYEFEEYLETVSKTSDNDWEIDANKLDFLTIYKIFDIEQQDPTRIDEFNTWFVNRFKPIFGKWKILVKQVSGEDKISWLEKAPLDKLLEVYKNFTMSYDAYQVKASPFSGVLMNTDTSVIKNFKDEWLLSLKKDAIKNKDDTTGKAIVETGKALVAGREAGQTDEETMSQFKSSQPTQVNTIKPPDNTNASTAMTKVDSSAGLALVGIFEISKLSALQSVIFKSYGLKDLRLSYLIALRNLENIVLDNIKIDSSGRAQFDGDIKKILEKASGYFGLTADGQDAQDWAVWFTNRFLPVYLGLHSCLFSLTKRTEVKTNLLQLDKLKASEALLIARAIIGTSGIWSVKEFAFRGVPVNNNPSSCNANINYLEQQSKEEEAQEQKLDKAPAQTNTPTSDKASSYLEQKPKQAVNPTPRPESGTAGSTASKVFSGIYQGAKDAFFTSDDDKEDKSYADKSGSSKPATTISNGSVGSLVSAPGNLMTGAGAMRFLKLADNANINGLHPSIKRLFLGMVEEYGQMTGKSIQVNRGYSSTQEQAALFNKYGPSKAARPGSSLHEFGLALDVQSADLEQLEKLGLLRKYGFTRPLGSEPWHLEPAGIHNAAVRAKAKKDHEYATSFIESGIGRGGGGLGSRGRRGELRRDDDYAKSIFDATSKFAKDESTPQAPTTAAASASAAMTESASKGASSPLASGMPEAEPIQGKNPGAIPSSPGGNAVTTSIKSNVNAANDELNKTSYDITSQVKGTVGSYSSLPDSTGTGWTGNGLLIKEAAKIVGVDAGLGAAIAAKESSLNPAARGKNAAAGNSVAQGMYQFMPRTWDDMLSRHGKKFGIPANASPMDPKANTLLGLQYIKESLSKGDGSPHEAYLGHFLGPTGLSRFRAMEMGDIPARILTTAAANNPNVFFHNGDKSRPRTKAEMINWVNQSLRKQLAEFNIPLQIGTLKDVDTTAVAANDSGSTNNSQALGSLANGDSRPMQKVNYVPPARQEPQRPPVSQLVQAEPVRSTMRTAPVVENKNNGLAKLETITEEHITVSRRTNDILVEIRDLLRDNFAQASGSKDSKTSGGAATESTSSRTNLQQKQAIDLPSSFVQRKRA